MKYLIIQKQSSLHDYNDWILFLQMWSCFYSNESKILLSYVSYESNDFTLIKHKVMLCLQS